MVNTALHVHEREGSFDSRAPASEMLSTYRSRLGAPLAVGFVGHDNLVRASHPDVATIDGIEHTKQRSPRRLHVVELRDYDIRYLAHPINTFPEDTREQAMAAVEEYDLDAVEKWNAGTKQYDGSLPVPEIAGDDAHSPTGTARSWMRVHTEEASADAVVDAIMDERFEVVNENPRSRDLPHTFDKAVLHGRAILRGDEPMPWESIL